MPEEKLTREQKATIKRARQVLGIPSTGQLMAQIVGLLLSIAVYLAVVGAVIAGGVWVVVTVCRALF